MWMYILFVGMPTCCIQFSVFTLPETYIAREKWLPKMKLVSQPSMFKGETASFGEGMYTI